MLGPHYQRLKQRSTFTALQCSRRPGRVGVEVDGEVVHVEGRAIVMVEGQLLLPDTSSKAG